MTSSTADCVLPWLSYHSYIFFSFFIEKDLFIRENKSSSENDESNEDSYYQYKPEEVAHFPIENHSENHEITSQLMFSCDTCDSAFSMKNDLEGHKEMSHLFTCDTCQSTFPLENDLESHKSTSHPLNFLYKKQQCNVCGKEFKTSEDLMTHKAMNHFSDLIENIETSTMSLWSLKIWILKKFHILFLCICIKAGWKYSNANTHVYVKRARPNFNIA